MSNLKFETKALHWVARNKLELEQVNSSNNNYIEEVDKNNSEEIINEIIKEGSFQFSRKELIRKLCFLENTEDALLCSSGNLAISQTIMGLTKTGDHILISKSCSIQIYKVILNLTQKMGISISYLDFSKPQNWQEQVKPNTKLIFTETFAVPSLELPDLKLLKNFSISNSILLVVDNSNCSAYLNTPFENGADVVVYSNTFYLDADSQISAGIILGKGKWIGKIRELSLENENSFSIQNAWVISKGLETLAIRLERQSFNALRVAEYLEKSQSVEKVIYPFLPSYSNYELAKEQMKYGGGIICFSMVGGIVRGNRFIECLNKFSSCTESSIRTTINHPASTSHAFVTEKLRLQMGARSNFLKLSIGLEHIDDIIEEIDTAIVNSKITFKLYKK